MLRALRGRGGGGYIGAVLSGEHALWWGNALGAGWAAGVMSWSTVLAGVFQTGCSFSVG